MTVAVVTCIEKNHHDSQTFPLKTTSILKSEIQATSAIY